MKWEEEQLPVAEKMGENDVHKMTISNSRHLSSPHHNLTNLLSVPPFKRWHFQLHFFFFFKQPSQIRGSWTAAGFLVQNLVCSTKHRFLASLFSNIFGCIPVGRKPWSAQMIIHAIPSLVTLVRTVPYTNVHPFRHFGSSLPKTSLS